ERLPERRPGKDARRPAPTSRFEGRWRTDSGQAVKEVKRLLDGLSSFQNRIENMRSYEPFTDKSMAMGGHPVRDGDHRRGRRASRPIGTGRSGAMDAEQRPQQVSA